MNRTLQDASQIAKKGSTERTSAAELPTRDIGRRIPVESEDLDKVAVLDLAYDEYCQLCDAGEAVEPQEFARRYPRYQHSIRLMLDVHRFLEGNPELLADAVEPDWPEIGSDYLGFTLLDELGRGSFARVFLASENDLGGRLVAIKVASDNAEEAPTIARLRHRNIVPIHSVRNDAATGRTLICMPYLGRATLSDLLDWLSETGWPARTEDLLNRVLKTDDERFPVAEIASTSEGAPAGSYVCYVLELGAALADALARTHAIGICHGDLKPSNVLLVAGGRPMLLDFNLSLAMGDVSRLGGTLPYIAPEQLEALTDLRHARTWNALDQRCDLFSLGAMLYELLTGELPFGDPPAHTSLPGIAQQLLQLRHAGPKPIRQINPRVDRRTAAIVERCLRYDAGQRPQSAAELAKELRRAASLPSRGIAWLNDHRKAALATVCCSIVTFLAVGTWWSGRPSPAEAAYSAGLELYSAGENDRALPLVEQAIAADATLGRAWLLRARIHAAQDRMPDAAVDCEGAIPYIRDGSPHAAAAYYRGAMLQYDMSIRFGEQALARGFRNAAVLNNLAYCYRLVGRWDDSIHAASQSIELHDRLPSPYFNRAVALHHGKRSDRAALEQAANDLQVAMQLGPLTRDIYFEAACVEIRLKAVNPDHQSAAAIYLTEAVRRGFPTPVLRHPQFSDIPFSIPKKVVSDGPRTAMVIDPLADF